MSQMTHALTIFTFIYNYSLNCTKAISELITLTPITVDILRVSLFGVTVAMR